VRAKDEFTSFIGASDTAGALGRRRSRWRSKLRRYLPQALSAVGAITTFWLVGSHHVSHGWAILPACLAWTAVTAHLWRAAEEAGSGSVLARRRARRVVYRAGIVLVYAAICTTSLAAVRDGLLAAAAALALAEPLIWRAYPRQLRDAYRRVRIQIAVMEAEPRWLGQSHGFDPGQGAVGRPGAADSLEPSTPTGPLTQRPTAETAQATDSLLDDESADLPTWWRYAKIVWDGSTLSVTDARIRTTTLPLHRDDGARDHVAEIAWCGIFRTQRTGTVAASLRSDSILFLDADGRQYARMPALGFRPRQIKLLAQAAGLPYHEYTIGVGSYGLTGLDALLFPPRPDTLIMNIR
jgi:hypothetical protein